MWIEISLKDSPTDHVTYKNVSRITYTSKHLKIFLKDGTEVRIPEKILEDTTWGTSKQKRNFK